MSNRRKFPSPRQRWKQVMLHRETYEELLVIARVEGRYLGTQLRLIVDAWKRQNLSKNDLAFLAAELAVLRTEAKRIDDAELAEERLLREMEERGEIAPRSTKKTGRRDDEVVGLRTHIEDTRNG